MIRPDPLDRFAPWSQHADHATAARIAATLGLDGHTRHTDEQQRKDFHTWFHGDNEHDSPLRLVWSGPSETAVAE